MKGREKSTTTQKEEERRRSNITPKERERENIANQKKERRKHHHTKRGKERAIETQKWLHHPLGWCCFPPLWVWCCFISSSVWVVVLLLLYLLGGGAFVPLSFRVVVRCSPPSFVWCCVPSFDVAVCVAQLGKNWIKSLTWTQVCKSLNQVSFCRARSTTSPKVEGRKTACIELNHLGNLRTFPFGGWKTPPRKKNGVELPRSLRDHHSNRHNTPTPTSPQPHRTTPRHATPRKNKVQW